MSKLNTFSIEIVTNDRTKGTKVNFGDKLASTLALPQFNSVPKEVALFGNSLTALNSVNGKVRAPIKARVEKYLADNTYANIPPAEVAQLIEYDVEVSNVFYHKYIINNFDKKLALDTVGSELAGYQASLITQLEIDMQEKLYAMFDDLADTFVPWKPGLDGKLTKPSQAANTTSGGATVEAKANLTKIKTAINKGVRALSLRKVDLDSKKGQFIEIFDELINYIKVIGINGKSVEGQPRRSGGVSTSEIVVLIDERFRKYFLEDGQRLYPGSVSTIDDRVKSVNGIDIVFKRLGTKSMYVLVKNTWHWEKFFQPEAAITGEAGMVIKGVASSSGGFTNVDKELLIGDKLYSYSNRYRFIKPDNASGLAWTINIT